MPATTRRSAAISLSSIPRFDPSRLGEKIGKDFAALLELSQDVAVSAKEILSEVDSNTLDFANVTSFRNDMESLRNQAVSLKGRAQQ
jgi:hypothetical protein